jgi:hypothetical protein
MKFQNVARRLSLPVFLSWVQGLYFTIFGLWPLIHIGSFQAVTGEKTDHLVTGRESDHWLVYTVALLITVIGVVLLTAAWRRRVSSEIALLGFASAAALASIDVLYVVRQTISPIYLADAAVEMIFIVGWIGVAVCRRWRPRHR